MVAAWFYVYLRWGFSVLLVIDPKAGRPSMGEAFKGSWRMTRGGSTIGSLFVLGIMVTLILIFSLACFVLPASIWQWAPPSGHESALAMLPLPPHGRAISVFSTSFLVASPKCTRAELLP